MHMNKVDHLFCTNINRKNLYKCISGSSKIIEGEYFSIFYNNSQSDIFGGPITALMEGNMKKFFILNGDHIQGYAIAAKNGYYSCLDYFVKNIKSMNTISDIPEDMELYAYIQK